MENTVFSFLRLHINDCHQSIQRRRTSLPVEDIIDLLSFCLNTTYFVFEGCYYQQVFGTAMWSPVSAVYNC